MKQAELFEAIEKEEDPDRANVLVELYKARAQEEATKFKVWSRSILGTVAVAALTGIIGIASSYMQHHNQVALEDRKAAHLLIRNAIQADRAATLANIRFLLDAGFINDDLYLNQQILRAAEEHAPRRAETPEPARQPSELGVSFFTSANILRLIEIHDQILPEFPLEIMELPATAERPALYTGMVPVKTGDAGLKVLASLLEKPFFAEAEAAAKPFLRALDTICADRETRIKEDSQIHYVACTDTIEPD